ncbi:MAG: 16S rRNA (cytidine(1402)-2'-O)-methyltransferase [Candidatus Peregrinibacteria bacterium]
MKKLDVDHFLSTKQEPSLFIIASPIGNLADFTFRAVETLKMVDYIASEDTRVTGYLLKHYGIEKKNSMISFHAQSGDRSLQKILALLAEGKSVAYLSDAGTPGISDPGTLLVMAAKQAGVKVIPLPGACALTTALCAGGVATHRFQFFGFLPHKKGRQTLLKDIALLSHTAVLYESTHRIEKFLGEVKEFFPLKKIVLARELTKIYEEFLTGTAEELLEILHTTPEKKKGEFVVLVAE